MNNAEKQTNSPLILVVDDDRTMRMMLNRAMKKEGYKVAQARDGIECLTSYKQIQPDMVLLDARMPKMDGFTCCQELQSLPGAQNTPVLMITGLEDEESVDRAFESGATDYITKPIHWAVLRYRVRRMLQEKQAETEMLKALERERELNELRARIVTMVSHEYRTPLTTILSSAELLEHYGEKWAFEKRNKHIKRIQSASHHMTRLVSDVMSISEVSSGQLKFQPQPANIESLCREVVDEVIQSGNYNNEISLTFQGEFDTEIIDAKLIRQIISNILLNAIQYSHAGKSVKFDAIIQRPGGSSGSDQTQTDVNLEKNAIASDESPFEVERQVIFRIQDQGIGISSEKIGQVFDAFYRGNNDGSIPGSGLGLTIAKKCVELHGGEITLESQKNVGTTVTVTLPVHSEP